MNKTFKRITATLALIVGVYVVLPPSISVAATRIDLANAASFGVLGASTVTNTGATVVSGTAGSFVGVAAGSSITGFPPGLSGGLHSNDALAIAAQASASAAYLAATSQPSLSYPLAAGTVTPGAYAIGTAASLTGTLTLNGNGDPNAVFIFTAVDSLTTAGASIVQLTNGAQACNVFWQVTSSATLGTNSTFVGHIDALISVTATTGATIHGSLMARTGAVTLDTNTIINDSCAPVAVVPVGSPSQASRIDSVSPSLCAVNGPNVVTINGVFPETITGITVNGASATAGSWVQSNLKVVLISTLLGNGTNSIQIYDGSLPILASQTFTCTAAVVPVVVPVVPVVTAPATGTLHVIKIVNNSYGGTATPADFTLWLRHHGQDVAGSPAIGVGGVGRTYVLEPGTYVLGEVDSAVFPNYISSFKIVGENNGAIVLKAGEYLTVIQYNNELPPLMAPETTVTPPTPVTPTETGGLLPKTSTPWFNLLIIGIGVMVVGGIALGLKRSPKI